MFIRILSYMVRDGYTRLTVVLPNDTNRLFQEFVAQRKIEKMETEDSELASNMSEIINEALLLLFTKEKKR